MNTSVTASFSSPSSRLRALRPSTLRSVPLAPRAPRQEEGSIELVERLLADDPTAWREFTRAYSGIILSVIRRVLARFTRVTGEHDVDEIYARFCLELLSNDKRKLRLFDPTRGPKLSSWLSVLAANSSYDYLRRVRRNSVNEPLPERDCFEANTPSAFELVALDQQASLAAQVLAELSDRDREFVELYFGEGLEAEEISERMGISVKTVYTKKHKITARLSAIVGRVCAA